MKKMRTLLALVLVIALTGCTILEPTSIKKAERLMDQDKIDDAIEVYEELIDEDEENYEAWIGLTEAYLEDKEYEDAADVIEEMAEIMLAEMDNEDKDFEDIYEAFIDLLEEVEDVDLDDGYDAIKELIIYGQQVSADIENPDFFMESSLVGIAMPTRSLKRWNQDGENLRSALEEAGYEVDLQFAENEVETQVQQIENMVSDGCGIIVVASIDGRALREVLQEAADAGIQIIAYDRLIYDTDNVDYYVTFDNYLVGRMQGLYIEEALRLEDGDGPYNLEVFGGSPDDNNAYFFNQGAMDVLQEYIDAGQLVVKSGQTDMSVIAIQYWRSETAQARMDNLLTAYYAYEDIDVVLSPNDSLAQGIVASLESAGYGTANRPFPVLTGQDCDINSVKLMMEGKQSMSVFKDTRALVDQTVATVIDIMNNETPETNNTYENNVKIVPSFLCSPVAVDLSNYEEILIDSDYYSQDDIDLIISQLEVTDSISTSNSEDWRGETLTIWTFTNEVIPAAEAFEDKYGVYVEVSIIPTEDYPSTIRPVLASGIGAPDVYTAEAAFLEEFVNEGYYADLETLGAAGYEDDYVDYAYQRGLDYDGTLRALTWQMTSGAVYYRRSIAREVFGTDDPDVISNMMGTYEGMFDMAEALNLEGYKLFPDTGAFRHFSNVNQTPWVDSYNNLLLSEERIEYLEYSKILKDNGYTAEAGEWSPTWFAGMQGPISVESTNRETTVFAYALPTWGLHYVLKTSRPEGANSNPTSGDWAAATGPNSYYWGGTWLGVYDGSDKKDIAFAFVNWLAHDEEYLKPWLMETGDVTSVISIIESSDYMDGRSEAFLGGQNHIEFFVEAAQAINGSQYTYYDDYINQLFGDAVDDYVNGYSSLTEALSDFKDNVEWAFPEINAGN